MTTDLRAPVEHRSKSSLPVLLPLLAGAAVSLLIGAYGRVHEPTGVGNFDLGFSSTAQMKAVLSTVVVALAGVQLLTALRMYDRIAVPRTKPAWLHAAHHWIGRVALLVSVPVAYECLYALGFSVSTPRGLVHSLLGCVVYGAFVAKVLSLRVERLPRWIVPWLGGLMFAGFVGLWLTGAVVFWFTGYPGVPDA